MEWKQLGVWPVFDPGSDKCVQLSELRQDLIAFEAGLWFVDVGWGPEYDLNGRFFVQLIRDGNWERPLLFYETQHLWDAQRVAQFFQRFAEGANKTVRWIG